MHALKKRTEISRELMVLKIEHGEEVMIPNCLSMERLPLSFRYYDPILRVVKKQMSTHKKNFYMLKQELAREMSGNTISDWFKNLLGPNPEKHVLY